MSSVSVAQMVAVARAFQQEHVMHCFTGHVAVNYWGYHRAFSGLDILVTPNRLTLTGINRALDKLGLPSDIKEKCLRMPMVRISNGSLWVDLYSRTNDGQWLTPSMIRWVSLGSQSIPIMRLAPLLAHVEAAASQYPDGEYADALRQIMDILRQEPRPLNPHRFLI